MGFFLSATEKMILCLLRSESGVAQKELQWEALIVVW